MGGGMGSMNMGQMMGGSGGPWMIGWMIFSGLLTLVLVASLIFVAVAGGRWLWHHSGPTDTSPATSGGHR